MTGPAAGSDTWIRRFHPAADTTVTLVCFPHAGGSASFYFPVSAALRRTPELAGGAEVLAVQYPGRQDRRHEAPSTDIGRLADRVSEALRPWAGRRLVFFGHSMGAIVAFEVARRLQRHDPGAPAALVASGRRAPSRRREESVHRRDDDGVIAELERLNGTDAGLLKDDELLRMFLPAIRGDYQAIETYDCPADVRLRCPVTVFVGDRDPQVTLDEAQDWAMHTTGPFDIEIFEGGHFYLTASPAETIDRLTRILKPHVQPPAVLPYPRHTASNGGESTSSGP